jgi:hypothetical protein
LRGVKLVALHRLASVALATSLVLACGGPGRAVTSPPIGPVTQPGGDPLLAPGGKHFAATRTYQGECMPAGSRGGCYSITLAADGSYRNLLLDAAVLGTYVIEGDQVKLTPGGDALPTTMTLSADRTRLDDYVYQPPVEQLEP